MEYVERSVQTDGQSRKGSVENKILNELNIQAKKSNAMDSFKENEKEKEKAKEKEKEIEKNTKPIDEEMRATIQALKDFRPPINLGRSVSTCERVRHSVPRVSSKRINQSCVGVDSLHSNDKFLPMDYNIRFNKPTPAESLPLLSAPPNIDNKKRLFSFSPDVESYGPEINPKSTNEEITSDSSGSKSDESMIDTTVTLRQGLSNDKLTEEEELPNEATETDNRRTSSPIRIPQMAKHSITSIESLPQGMIPSDSSPGDQSLSGPPKTGRRIHPTKFLKRAQSFSQAFKKITDTSSKKKRPGEVPPIRDDFSIMAREPQGEMDLIPLDKLITMEHVQMSRHETIHEN